MKRWFLQLAFGLAIGVAARATLPGRHSDTLLMAAVLSGVGAAGGGALARAVLPGDLIRSGGLMLAGLGAIAAQLIQAVLAQ